MQLPQVQEIDSLERRVLAEYKPPGMQGNLLQNMGRRPLRLSLWGVAIGMDAQPFLQKLDTTFRAGKPVPFTADIIADARVERVIVEDLRVQELAGKPQRYAFVLLLREYIEPVTPEDTSGVDADVLADAQKRMNDLMPGLTSGLDFATGLGRFVDPLSAILTRLEQFSHQIGAHG
jgi:hypothetical protein